jgi:glycosyltransferase involved in cell wall biosynthesis
LWLAGTGPMRESLFEQIESRGLGGRVLLPGAFDDLGLLLAATDALVLPGTDDGTPLAMFEAMAAGLPVVAADTPGHRVLATHEENALLVPAGDASAWLAALTQLLGRSGLARKLGAAGRRRIEQQFTLANSVQQHLTLFENLARTDDESNL